MKERGWGIAKKAATETTYARPAIPAASGRAAFRLSPIPYPLSPVPYSATRRICAPSPCSFSSMHS
jgi:hypothetical protein